MRDVFVIGTAMTHFKRWPDRSHKSLADEAVRAVLADAGIAGSRIDTMWFGNCGMHCWGQANIRGQVLLRPLVQEGVLPERAPVTNVEGGCATGSMALHGAIKDIRAGDADVALALGVEKTFMPTMPEKMLGLFDGALDQLDTDWWREDYAAAATALGVPYKPHPARIQLLDVCALEAAHHMAHHGTTSAQIASSAAKNHDHGALNPLAQYQQRMTVDDVLADKAILAPFTRAMCAPISDGAAAVLVVSADVLRTLSAATRARAVRVRASVLTGGKARRLDEPSLARVAADRAYAGAGLTPADVDVVELHDATAFAEIYLQEMLRFASPGKGGAYVASGQASLGGLRPTNTSGGLVSKGHPLGATGLAMVHELALQLRGEAGERQVSGARIALQQNGGGLIGFDEAACHVGLFEGPAR